MNGADSICCNSYRQGLLEKNEIAIYDAIEEISLVPPTQLQKLRYREAYIKQPHLRGRSGYPYETVITFEMDIDTGQPVPQSNQEYHRKYKQNRDFQITIRSTWLDLYKHISSDVSLPVEEIIPYNAYEIVENKYAMDRISYLNAITGSSAGENLARRFDSKNEIFIKKLGDAVIAYMTCHKHDAYKIPHCKYRQIIGPLFVETTFKRSLISDFSTIRKHTKIFTQCLMQE